MKILIAADKFKGSLSSEAACNCIAAGIRQVDASADVMEFPMADGGDGFATVLQYYLDTQTVTCQTFDPLMRPMDASYQWDTHSKTAIIELAASSGLLLLSKQERNPLLTSTFGTGLLIKHAIAKGAEKIVLGLGGSATNDAGIGILAALGFKLFDKAANVLTPNGESLQYIYSVISPAIMPDINFEITVDVQNVLSSKNGAAFVYAAQKGATVKDIFVLDKGLQNFARIVQSQTRKDIDGFSGAGAAGGVAAGLMAYFDVRVSSGAQLLIERSSIKAQLKDCDLIITGEGKLDAQSLCGKVVAHIAKLANQYHIPVIALCGSVDINQQQINELGLLSAVGLADDSISEETATNNAASLLKDLAAKVFSAFIQSSKK